MRSGKLRIEPFKFKEFTIQVFKLVLRGITEVLIKIIKNSISLIAPILTNILNCCFNSNTFPSDLKRAIA